jgi:hypothetical protein
VIRIHTGPVSWEPPEMYPSRGLPLCSVCPLKCSTTRQNLDIESKGKHRNQMDDCNTAVKRRVAGSSYLVKPPNHLQSRETKALASATTIHIRFGFTGLLLSDQSKSSARLRGELWYRSIPLSGVRLNIYSALSSVHKTDSAASCEPRQNGNNS